MKPNRPFLSSTFFMAAEIMKPSCHMPDFMSLALDEARAAVARGEVPVGAVLVSPQGEVLASAGNRTEELFDPTAHAEVLAIRQAASLLGSPRLVGCDLYVTLEPCSRE